MFRHLTNKTITIKGNRTGRISTLDEEQVKAFGVNPDAKSSLTSREVEPVYSFGEVSVVRFKPITRSAESKAGPINLYHVYRITNKEGKRTFVEAPSIDTYRDDETRNAFYKRLVDMLT